MNFACQGLAPPRKRPPFSNAQKAGSRGGFATQSLYRIDLFPRYTRKKTTFEADNCTPKSLSLVSTRFVFFCFAPALYCIDLCIRYTRKKTTFEANNCTPKSLSLVSTRFRVRKREKAGSAGLGCSHFRSTTFSRIPPHLWCSLLFH